MARVFISHASEDLACAVEIRYWLRTDGHDVFLDRDLQDGLELGQVLVEHLFEELHRADAVVAVVTEAFVASTWTSVEVGAAYSRGALLLPVRATPDVEHPLLRHLVHADYGTDRAGTRERLLTILRRVDGGGTAWREGENPYPGLEPFDSGLAGVFFGRRKEIRELSGKIRADLGAGRLLAVVGPSGCGKSSLLRAGVASQLSLEPAWVVVSPVIPGGDPMSALAANLARVAIQEGVDLPLETINAALGSDAGLGEVAVDICRGGRGSEERHLFIFIDQAEELFTVPTGPAERESFIRVCNDFVRLLVAATKGSVRVVVALQSEFLDALQELPDIGNIDVFLVGPLARDMLPLVIKGPAGRAGIRIDDDLVEELVDDTGGGEALPLLAFTLYELARGRSRGSSLSSDDYDRLGGVKGALTRRADAALAVAADQSGLNEREILAGLVRLVSVDEAGRIVSRRRRDLPDGLRSAFGAFVDHRLLTTGRDDQGGRWVGVAHETFLAAWQPLAEKIEEVRESVAASGMVVDAAERWEEAGRPSTKLLHNSLLARAKADIGARLRYWRLVTEKIELPPLARAFLAASLRRDFIRRTRVTIVLAMALVIVLTAAGFAAIVSLQAEDDRREDISRALASDAAAIRVNQPWLSLLLGIEAYRVAHTDEARRSLIDPQMSYKMITPMCGEPSRPCHEGSVGVVIWGGRHDHTGILLTAGHDGKVNIWRTSPDGSLPVYEKMFDHGGPVESAALNADLSMVATGGTDGTIRIWDVQTGSCMNPMRTK